ncbi:hypothetical protein PVL29_012470 [Vitis rotundifolia]|uniref:PGG domain-containing protein n=1 Tax=Vitis rotundifolia TaxID=103349 RepID=A0AA39DPT5_VITRO|nr:hypothetical protein PVL29_012470 [Vitis rotundifolia]
MEDEDADDELNRKLYIDMMNRDEEEVIKICKNIPEGPLHIMTTHDDTVLQMATYARQADLVLKLLEDLPEAHLSGLIHQNDTGNTTLHDAATSDSTLPAAKEMMAKAPQLLSLTNNHGETPIFRAARYGKNKIFNFLAGDVDKICGNNLEGYLAYIQRRDKTTILHISVLTENFDLAESIARRYKHLINLKDGDGMTALQLLACNPSAFKSGSEHGFLKQLLFSCVSTKEESTVGGEDQVQQAACKPISFISDFVRKEKARYESALKLAKLLILRDTSWKATKARQNRSKPKTHRYSPSTPSSDEKGRRNPSFSSLSPGHEEKEEGLTGLSQESSKSPFNESGGEGEVDGSPENDMTPIMRTGEIPLFLATRSGIQEIVKEILAVHPQAFEHIKRRGKNILHFAIKYCQIEIFNLVMMRGIPYCICLGKKRSDYVPEKIQSPALQLQKELILFERVKEVSADYFTKHLNEQKHTPEGLFAPRIVVAAFIATVAFAAAYTIPGGPNQNTGFPLLLYQPFFVIFTLSDAVSLTFALTSVNSLPQRLMLGFTFLILSASMMMVAFAATIVLMIHNKERWTKIVLYSVAFLPVTVFAISYSPLYLSLLEACKYPVKLTVKACPRCNYVRLKPLITGMFKHKDAQANSSSTNPHKSQV